MLKCRCESTFHTCYAYNIDEIDEMKTTDRIPPQDLKSDSARRVIVIYRRSDSANECSRERNEDNMPKKFIATKGGFFPHRTKTCGGIERAVSRQGYDQ